ncbi:MAG TPA: hypothetical protein VK276_06685 [Rubrobacteraceae bacterium]|nr:hypothetical protein [Rubrobacteraceae bacterium]
MRENAEGRSSSRKTRARLDGLRPALGAAFLAAYAWSNLAPSLVATAVFLATGIILYALSVPWASAFHKGLALVSFVALGAVFATGRFDADAFVGGLPDYYGVVAVLLVLSVAGYPIRAARYEAQIRALVAALRRRGAGVGTASGIMGHVLGAVLDVGAFVLIDVILGRAAPNSRIDALTWAGRGFSFAPLWTNLNVFTATTIVLTGVSYPNLLAATLPFALLGLAATSLFAQREKGEAEDLSGPDTALDRKAAAVVLYPVLLVATVALANLLFPGLSLMATIAVTVAVVVIMISVLATVFLRRASPLGRLASETRGSLVASHAEFALFGSAGILVLSLEQIGALAPLGNLLSALPAVLVAPALMLTIGVGFVIGIHVIPMILLINTAFPLDGGSAPTLWAVALLLGAQSALLLTPFSSAVTMLARLTGLHPLEIGPKRNWGFGLAVTLAAILYLGLLTLLLT